MESIEVYISLEPKCKEKTLFYGMNEKACFHSERNLGIRWAGSESEETAEEAEGERGKKEHSDLDDSDFISDLDESSCVILKNMIKQ